MLSTWSHTFIAEHFEHNISAMNIDHWFADIFNTILKILPGCHSKPSVCFSLYLSENLSISTRQKEKEKKTLQLINTRIYFGKSSALWLPLEDDLREDLQGNVGRSPGIWERFKGIRPGRMFTDTLNEILNNTPGQFGECAPPPLKAEFLWFASWCPEVLHNLNHSTWRTPKLSTLVPEEIRWSSKAKHKVSMH